MRGHVQVMEASLEWFLPSSQTDNRSLGVGGKLWWVAGWGHDEEPLKHVHYLSGLCGSPAPFLQIKPMSRGRFTPQPLPAQGSSSSREKWVA